MFPQLLHVAEKAIETSEAITSYATVDDENSLRGSLAVVRKSAHAAALIQATFCARSFRQRQLTQSSNDIPEASIDIVALGSVKRVQKFSHYEDYLHSATALKIQRKYRGWKGRKEFLKICNRIVKIQAYVRGHQVRKNYKKLVWSVGIMEKVILRWRRKRPSLRGFRGEKVIEDVSSENKRSDDYECLSVGRKQKFAGVEKALVGVQSMSRHPEAHEQYMRLQSKFEKLKMADGSAASSGCLLLDANKFVGAGIKVQKSEFEVLFECLRRVTIALGYLWMIKLFRNQDHWWERN